MSSANGGTIRRINSLIQARSRSTFSRFLIHNSNFFTRAYNEALKMDKNKDIYYRMTQLFVFLLRSITAFSYLYFPMIWLLELNADHFGGEACFAVLTMWMVVEILFFLMYYHQYVRFNDQRPRLRHRAKDRETRIKLLRSCFSAMSDGSLDQSRSGIVKHLRKVMEGWFLNVPLEEIYYDNLAQWTAFAFFGKELEDMSIDEISDNREIIRIVETEYLEFKFPRGLNPDAPGMRLNFDPLVVTQRPFIFYLFFYVVNSVSSTVLHFLLGFSLRETHCKSGVLLYHRSYDKAVPDVKLGSEKTVSDLSFFELILTMYDNSSIDPKDEVQKVAESAVDSSVVKPNSNAYPIVFIHGLGIGFAHYIYLIARLPRDRDVYLVEMPYVCMRLDAVAPNMGDTVTAIVEILTADGYAGEVLPGSSPGTRSSASTNPSDNALKTPSRPTVIKAELGSGYSLRSRNVTATPKFTPEPPSRSISKSPVRSKRSKSIDEAAPVKIDHVIENNFNPMNHKLVGACFMGHSLGTTVISWMLHNQRTKALVASTVLIDPVTFLLCMPKVCASFVHPDPKCVSTYLSSFLLAKELYISNALSRHFSWSYNAVFLEELPGAWEKENFAGPLKHGMPVFDIIESHALKKKMLNTIIVAKDDHIVPIENVCAYFQKRSTAVYERAYGREISSKRPERPHTEVVTDDNSMDMLNYCKGNLVIYGTKGINSPRPPAPVFRERTESLDEVDEVFGIVLPKIETPKNLPPSCWFEWIVLDCAHGEQMMVPKYLEVILEKAIERSTYNPDW